MATPELLEQDAMVDLARWAGGLTLADIPALVVDDVKRRLLDLGFDRAAGRVIPMPITVDVHLRDREMRTRRSEFPLGHPGNPMDWPAVAAKVWDCAAWGRLPGLLARAKAVPA